VRVTKRHILAFATASLIGGTCLAADNGAGDLADLQKQLDALQKAVDNCKLPQAKELDQVLREISNVGVANSVQTTRIRAERADYKREYGQQPVVFSMTGDFRGMYGFLQQVEKLARPLRITHLDWSKTPDGQLNARITFNLFFATETTPAAAPAPSQPRRLPHDDDADLVDQLQAMQDKQKSIAQQAQLTAALTEKLPRSAIVASIIDAMPRGTSLVELRVDSEGASAKGNAKDDEQVKQFAAKLSNENVLRDVRVKQSNGATHEFQIDMNLNSASPLGRDATAALEANK